MGVVSDDMKVLISSDVRMIEVAIAMVMVDEDDEVHFT